MNISSNQRNVFIRKTGKNNNKSHKRSWSIDELQVTDIKGWCGGGKYLS